LISGIPGCVHVLTLKAITLNIRYRPLQISWSNWLFS